MALKVVIFCCLMYAVWCGDVLDLSGGDFEDRVLEHDAILVEFFAPWCGHCKRLAPEYEKAATALKKADPPIPLAKVDCTADGAKDTCSKFGVSGYPTLKIFRNGEFSTDYNGPREADGIVKYMKAQVGPVSKELSSLEEAEKFVQKEDSVVVGFFKDKASKLKEAFTKAAEKLRESHSFAHSSSEDVLAKFGYSDEVVLFRPKKFHSKFEPKEEKYSGPADKAEIQKFVKKQSHGLVGHRTHDNHEDFKAPLVVVYFDVDYVKNVKGTNYWRNRVMKAAEKFRDSDLSFAVSDRSKFSAEVEDYGLAAPSQRQADPKAAKPAVAARNARGQKFNMKDEFSVENLEKFVRDFVAERLEPHLKSEALPEKNDGDVKIAVGQNFEEVVTNNPKDVLIEFYAPWCGHCKKLAPTFEELGAKMRGEDVEIVKMDATANDVPSTFEVHGFPTLYWLPKDNKEEPRKYEGAREMEDFVKYIAKHATDELKGYDRSGKENPSKEEL